MVKRVVMQGGLVLFVVATFALGEAAVIAVTTTEDELSKNGKCSLREAVQASNTKQRVNACRAGTVGQADTITIPAGTYLLHLGDLGFWQPMRLVGAGAAQTIIDAQGLSRIAVIELVSASVQVLFRHVTLAGGVAPDTEDEGGGAIVVWAGKLRMEDAVIERSQALGQQGGGAVQVWGRAKGSFLRTTFRDNAAGWGGAIANTGSVWLKDAQLDGNAAWDGPAIAAYGEYYGPDKALQPYTSVKSTRVQGHTEGRAPIHIGRSQMLVEQSTFLANQGTEASALLYEEATLTVRDSVFEETQECAITGFADADDPTTGLTLAGNNQFGTACASQGAM